MHVNKEGNLFIVKLYKDYVNNFDIYDIDSIMNLFKSVFMKVTGKYDIKGLCLVDVYINDLFGMIIEIDNVCNFYEEIDIKVTFHVDSIFFSEIGVNDIDNFDIVYYYKNKYYTNYDKNIDSAVLYKDNFEIVNNGIKLK